MPLVAGVYARISLDRKDGAGVDRQLADCRALADQRGWEVVEYVDNSMSAFKARRRPEFRRMVDDLAQRRIGAITAYHVDRLYRHPSDLDDIIDAVEATGAAVATVQAGDLDLSTASGRMVARIFASVNRHEVERIGERVSRAKKELAAQGRPSGGGLRPFGYTADRTGLVVDEAAALAAAASAIVAGSSFTAQARRLNDEGFTTTTGAPWTAGTIRRTLCSPHVAALRTYHDDIVGEATWPPIVDRPTWDALRAIALTRKRGRPLSPRNLLTGILKCGLCGHDLRATTAKRGRRDYACSSRPTYSGAGCGGISITAAPTEALVVDAVSAWLADRDFVIALGRHLSASAEGDDSGVELAEIDRRLGALAERFGSGDLSDREWDAARKVLGDRRREIEARAAGNPARGRSMSVAQIVEAWADPDLDPEDRRAIIAMMVGKVTVLAGKDEGGVRRAVADRLVVTPRWPVDAPQNGP